MAVATVPEGMDARTRARADEGDAPAPRTGPVIVTLARHLLALLIFTLLTITQAPRVTLHPSRTVTPDLIDPVHHIWSVALVLHDVWTWRDGLWSLFDANIFYPVQHAAAFADTFVGLLPLLLPLSLLTHDPATLANGLLALSFILSAYGAFLLGRELTGSYPAALVCGLAFGFCALHVEQVGRVTVASMQWQALAAWCLVRAWRRGTLRWWVLAGLFLGLAAVTNLYYLAYLTLPLLVAALSLGRAWTPRRLRGALLAAGLAAILAAPMLLPYLTRRADVGPGYRVGSTDVLSFISVLAGRPIDSLLLPTVHLVPLQAVPGLFPGFVVLALAAVGWRRGWARPWGLYALCCFVLALGPRLVVAGRVLPLPLPYALLSAAVPHFALFRDPTRATAGAALGLAVAAAYGLHSLAPRRHWRRWLAGLLVALVALEAWTPLPVARLSAIPAGAYRLARQPAIHAIAVLPIANDTPLDWARQTELMRESTVNWTPMVNGSESLDPVGMAARRSVLSTYPSPAALQLLRRLRVDAVVLRLPWLTPMQRAAMLHACPALYRDSTMAVCAVG